MRWQFYETLKYVCSQFVGWYAEKREISDSDSYCQMMEALDLLLPTPEIEHETMEDLNREMALQLLRDGVLQIYPQVKLPEHRSRKEEWQPWF